MNKIAIIILAHHNPEQLSILINHLKTDFDLYVQIDKKSDLQINALPVGQNIFYHKDIEVYWGDFSQVLSMYTILKNAYLKKDYDNYLYISGDDFPIKTNTFIKNFFNKNKSSIFMYANPLPISTWGFNHGFDRLDRYWFMKIKSRKFVKALARFTLYLQRLFFIKNKRFPLKYYAGSNWINLTRESVTYIFNFIEKNPTFFKRLKYSRATDELWAQSILMNSPLKEKIVNHDLRYIDWSKGPDYPRTLDLTDYDNLLESDALFARKINIKKDKELLFKILGLTSL
ncbi:beta-1,6-N-acetylglucosaminyltransferase [Flavobacteriaceae bacterium SZ-1-7]|uniref:beta-1,6-N-acetylglucosaminyltransferase n=1 Tax=Tamlana sedimenti TaxID=3134126 RepID=UPI003124E351